MNFCQLAIMCPKGGVLRHYGWGWYCLLSSGRENWVAKGGMLEHPQCSLALHHRPNPGWCVTLSLPSSHWCPKAYYCLTPWLIIVSHGLGLAPPPMGTETFPKNTTHVQVWSVTPSSEGRLFVPTVALVIGPAGWAHSA